MYLQSFHILTKSQRKVLGILREEGMERGKGRGWEGGKGGMFFSSKMPEEFSFSLASSPDLRVAVLSAGVSSSCVSYTKTYCIPPMMTSRPVLHRCSTLFSMKNFMGCSHFPFF